MRMLPLLFLTGLGAILLPGLAALARPAPDSAGAVLVVAPPWGGGAAGVVRLAGGAVIGPAAAALSVTATGASPQEYLRAGAWAVLDAAAVAAFCGKGVQG